MLNIYLSSHGKNKTEHFEWESWKNSLLVAIIVSQKLIIHSFQVWVVKKDVEEKFERIPTPATDVRNIMEEIHFTDESTRSRCRGWVVLPSRRYLQADILFPGCEFDCRLIINEHAGIFAAWLEKKNVKFIDYLLLHLKYLAVLESTLNREKNKDSN